MAISQKESGRPCPRYRAFLLRCWQELGAGQDRELSWRFAVVQADGTKAPRGFASLEEFCAYLRRELGEVQRSHHLERRA